MNSDLFSYVKIEGDPRERGLQHGNILEHRIKKVIKFYRKVFNREEEDILGHAAYFKNIINNFNKDYGKEIESIAEGASVDPLWIYALNSRSEILTMFVNECTALFSRESRILAQNWDWAKELEELAVIMKIKSANHEILMMTEPGIIGKIGMNNKGLGVTLNFLHSDLILDGVPIHIILRALLDTTSFEKGIKLIRDISGGQVGNIIYASDTGSYMNLEFAGDELYEFNNKDTMVHTNHYLQDRTRNTREEILASSYARYKRANELISKINGSQDIIATILADQKNRKLPICRPYVKNPDIGNTGTICSIKMDLKERMFWITPGNPFDHEYVSYSLQ